MATVMKGKGQTLPRVSHFFPLIMLTVLLLWRGWGAIQVNRAFVTLNHLPELFHEEEDDPILAAVAVQLQTAQHHLGATVSIQRMVAVVHQAQGEADTTDALGVDELVWWGEQKTRLGDWPAAATLYRWATEQQPGLGDAWLRLGEAYQAQNLLDEASHAYQSAAAASTWHTFGRSDAYLALGNLTAESDTALARGYYEQALQVDQFGSAAATAAAHYQLGELLMLQEGNPNAALPHYQATLALTPDDHWARLRLGYALYWGTGDLAAAAAAIQQAIATWPDAKYLEWPYFYLGEMYQDAGLLAEAEAAYEQVLRLDPAHTSAQQRLTVLRSP